MDAPDLEPGRRWLHARTPAQRKAAGQWATPWWVVQAVTATACRDLPADATIVDPACGDGRWLLAARRHLPDARLVGIDSDPAAIAAARATAPGADLRVADALAPDAPFPRADLVLGNPPWVRPQHLEQAVREDLWARFETATDKADLYACFTEQCLDRAERTALVLPEGWLHLASFAALRARVLRAGLTGIWRLPPRTFEGMPVPAVVLRTGTAPRDSVADAPSPGPTDARAGRLDRDGFVDEGPVHLGDHVWSLAGPLPRLPGRPLGDFVTLHMGVVCGDYDRYVHTGRRHPEDRPTCRGRDVHRWTIDDRDEYVWYVPRDMLDRKPYVAPKHAGIYDVPAKVVIAGTTGTELRAAVDTDRRFPLDSCYVALPKDGVDPWAILGFLLSTPAQRWYGARHRAARVKAVELRRIPLPEGGWEAVAAAARARDDVALDRAVARAYGL